MINIRRIQQKDNNKIAAIIRESLESAQLAIPGTAYYDPQLDTLSQYYENRTYATYWVAEMKEEIVGGIGIAPFDSEQGISELQKLYVSPKAKGLGLSKKLMDTAMTYAKQHYQYCYLETHHTLTIANKLYHSYGFELLDTPLPGSDHSAMNRWYIKSF